MDWVEIAIKTVNSDHLISVVVCTRNRGASIAETLESLLANDAKSFEVVVIDQSTNEDTRLAVDRFLKDERLHYFPTQSKGLGLARNIGLAYSSGEVVCMTDDDCVVPPNWLNMMSQVFVDYPNTAVVFCNVEAGEHDPDAGFVPAYVTDKTRVMHSVRDWCADHGIGAGMAVRREAMKLIGEFDNMLGAGAKYPSQEDADISLRALLKGYTVVQTTATSVIHNGFRTWQQGSDLGRRDCLGVGAGYAKLIRCSGSKIFFVWLFELYHFIVQPAFRHIVRLRKPPVVKRTISLLEGFNQGWNSAIDKNRMVFIESDTSISKAAQ